MAEEKKADVGKQVRARIKQKEEAQERRKEAQEQKEQKQAEPGTAQPGAKSVKEEQKAEAEPKTVEKPKPEEKPKAVEKPKPEERPKAEEKLKEERIITVSLRRAWNTPRTKRASAAVKVLKSQLEKHLKKPVKLDSGVNRRIWRQGITSPPHKLKLRIKVFETVARAFLA